MAGDWIKMRTDLREDPTVYRLAEILGCDELMVVGALFCFWAWADKHCVDGRVDGASSRLVDKVSCIKGFSDALSQVGWLVFDEKGASLPRFDRHNGESAKERNLKNMRQARWREGKKKEKEGFDYVDATPSTKASTREEKRREDISTTPKASKFSAKAFLLERGADPQLAADWLEVRKTKKLASTKTAFDDLMAEVEKAGLPLDDVLRVCCKKGWGGFMANWPRGGDDTAKPWEQ